ncbi:MAG TPA: type I 3-dehydroquinate dehydratase [Chthoniobacterales bacterium]|nr:type I 3-dehydroquinate dehydratase [Chthoniobacterales bacterium]
MTTRRGVKAPQAKLVAVIASSADLDAAAATKQRPDLFELRLDSLLPITNYREKKICRLPVPLIITARDPREGGIGNLSLETRHALLQRFLTQATFLDVELRSVRDFRSLLAEAKKRKVRRILSYHNFKSTPSSRSLCAKAKQAKALGADIFKVATRTDSPAALSRLLDFMTSKNVHLPISAMGIGKLGGISRLLLARCGSVLNYAALERPNVEGQLSIAVLRSALGR